MHSNKKLEFIKNKLLRIDFLPKLPIYNKNTGRLQNIETLPRISKIGNFSQMKYLEIKRNIHPWTPPPYFYVLLSTFWYFWVL